MTILNRVLDDWTTVKNHCRRTMNKEFTENEPSEKFKRLCRAATPEAGVWLRILRTN